MHRIVKAHLESFVKNFGFEAEDEASQFEKFSNHSIIASRFPSPFEIDDVSTENGDDGIDGVAIAIDEEICVSLEDAQGVFRDNKRNHDVNVIFIQAKRSESFDLGEFLKFKEGIIRFVTSANYECKDEVLQNAKGIFDVILKEVPKIRNGRPSLIARGPVGNFV